MSQTRQEVKLTIYIMQQNQELSIQIKICRANQDKNQHFRTIALGYIYWNHYKFQKRKFAFPKTQICFMSLARKDVELPTSQHQIEHQN